MNAALDRPLPNETRATCDRCAMCEGVAPEMTAFNPATKCCTYTPSLPNFLVGRVLADQDPAGEAGRASVRARIASGIEVTPLGLGVPASYGLLYRHGAERTFGQALAMRCPHYVEDGGRCGIWRHRNAVCATWFCKHVRGAAGWRLWQRVRELLSAIESELARACVLELGVDGATLGTLFPPVRAGADAFPVGSAELDRRPEPSLAAATWGAWAGREVELYVACAERVGALSAAETLRLCGQEVRVRAEIARAALRRYEEAEPPDPVRPGPLVVLRAGPESCCVTTYSPLDPLEIPRELLDVLHRFDGRSCDAAREAIVEDGGPRLTPGLVRKLIDFAVLVGPDPAANP